MNGERVIRRGKTIFIPLTRDMWEPIEGGCSCPHCGKAPDGQPTPAFWDTLAVAQEKPKEGADTAWYVHMPEIHK